MSRVRVVTTHLATYPDPIQVQAGTPVQVGREDEQFPGWKWCSAPDGRAGWVPESLLSQSDSGWVVAEDYSALELSVEPGEVLEVGRILNGWLWARNARGEWGWLPETHATPEG